MALNFYVGAVIEPAALFFQKAERIFLLSQGRYVIPGDRLTVMAFHVDKTNLTTQEGDDYFRFAFAFAECCDGCKAQHVGKHAHHRITATLAEMEYMFIVNPKKSTEKVTENDSATPKATEVIVNSKFTATDLIEMMTRIVRLWDSRLTEEKYALHFGRFKYELIRPTTAPRLRLAQINGYSVKELLVSGTQSVPVEWVDPLASYFQTYRKELDELDRLEAEIADISHRLGYNVHGAS